MNKKKRTDDEVIKAYLLHGSVWKAATYLGMCGQSVYERIKKLNIKTKHQKLNCEEIEKLKQLYSGNFYSGDGSLKKLAESLGRNFTFLSKKARKLGLTNNNRKKAPELVRKNSENLSRIFKKQGHPKGFLGKKHSLKSILLISEKSKKSQAMLSKSEKSHIAMKAMQTKLKKYGSIIPQRHKTTWKQGWREIGGKRFYFRSKWEMNYARVLEFQKNKKLILDWDYEPKTFWFEKIKTGTRCYTPDFQIKKNDFGIEYHEVKGWMDNKSKTKIKRMRIYYPECVLIIIDSNWFKKWSKMYQYLIKDWE